MRFSPVVFIMECLVSFKVVRTFNRVLCKSVAIVHVHNISYLIIHPSVDAEEIGPRFEKNESWVILRRVKFSYGELIAALS
jgi:hypothetical protein